MRITDVTVVLHERVTTGSASSGPRGGRQPLGVPRVMTDEGVEGDSFLSGPGPGPVAIAEQIVTVVNSWRHTVEWWRFCSACEIHGSRTPAAAWRPTSANSAAGLTLASTRR